MRQSVRNKQNIYYANFVSREEIIDAYGNKSGQWKITYGTPVLMKWNVHGIESSAEVEMFGTNAINTLRIVAEKPLPIDENSVFWFDKIPANPYVATAPDYNYVVKGILPTLYDGVFYIQKVTA